MLRSQLKSPYGGRIPTEKVRPGLYAAPEAYTGEYRFFSHSEPEYYIRGQIATQLEYRRHVCSVLLRMNPPSFEMETICNAMVN